MKRAGWFLLILLLLVNLGLSLYLFNSVRGLPDTDAQLQQQDDYFQNKLEQLEKFYQNVNYQEQVSSIDKKLFENYREAAFTSINKAINYIVEDEPVLGARNWYVTGIKFITPDIVYINYEDGHIGGALLLRLTNLQEDQWQKLYQFDEKYIFDNDLWNIDWDWKR